MIGSPETLTIWPLTVCVVCLLLVAALWEPDELQDALDRQTLNRAPVSPDNCVRDEERIEHRFFGGFDDRTEALVQEPAIAVELGLRPSGRERHEDLARAMVRGGAAAGESQPAAGRQPFE